MIGTPYRCAKALKQSLLDDGWKSPDTYCNFFAPIISGPAVYLFVRYEDRFFERALVAYVGMSTNLQRRLRAHEMLPKVREGAGWAMRWFKPTDASDLRSVEAHYIRKFNPPWNIAGRERGFVPAPEGVGRG